MKIRELSYALGAEISDVDISKPLSKEVADQVRAAFHKHSVLLFRRQPLTPPQFVTFSKEFGELSKKQSRHFADYPEITTVVNTPKPDGGPADDDYNGSDWHSDISYRVAPTIISMLRAVVLPQVGGDTEFSNQYLAYETLSDAMKRLLDGLEGVHMQQEKDLDHSSLEKLEEDRRDKIAAHPLVRVHPETGRKHLYVGDKVVLIAGMSPEESKSLLDFLRGHSRRPQFVYRHQWKVNDLLIWDQRCTNHNALGNFDRRTQPRTLEKTTVPGPAVGRAYVDTTNTRNLTNGYTFY